MTSDVHQSIYSSPRYSSNTCTMNAGTDPMLDYMTKDDNADISMLSSPEFMSTAELKKTCEIMEVKDDMLHYVQTCVATYARLGAIELQEMYMLRHMFPTLSDFTDVIVSGPVIKIVAVYAEMRKGMYGALKQVSEKLGIEQSTLTQSMQDMIGHDTDELEVIELVNKSLRARMKAMMFSIKHGAINQGMTLDSEELRLNIPTTELYECSNKDRSFRADKAKYMIMRMIGECAAPGPVSEIMDRCERAMESRRQVLQVFV